MSAVDHASPGRRRKGGWRFALAGAVVVVALAWSALWFMAQREAATQLDHWVAAEATHGRSWTCPDRTVDGFPFAVRLHCTKPTFHGEVAGRTSSGTLEALDAEAALTHATQVMIEPRGPMILRADDDDYKMIASWEGLRLTLGSLPGALDRGALDAGRLAITITSASGDDINIRVGHVAGQADPQANAAGGVADAVWSFSASAVSFPTVDAFTGSQEPFEASGHGVLMHAALLSAPTARRLEAWRQAGGQLRLTDLTLSKGSFNGQAKGILALDDVHRPTGRLDTNLKGFGPIAERLGIPVAGVKIGGLLTSLLGGGNPAPQPAAADAVALPLVLADGHLAIGVFKTPIRLDPFY